MTTPERIENTLWINEHPMRGVIGLVGTIWGLLLIVSGVLMMTRWLSLTGMTFMVVALFVGWRVWLFRW